MFGALMAYVGPITQSLLDPDSFHNLSGHRVFVRTDYIKGKIFMRVFVDEGSMCGF